MVALFKDLSAVWPSRWGGGMLVLLSLGLHGVVLSMPVTDRSPDAESLPEESHTATDVIDVVQLPATPEAATPEPEPEPMLAVAPTPAPPPQVSQPTAPPTPTQAPAPAAAPPTPEESEALAPAAPPEPTPQPSAPLTTAERLRTPSEYEYVNRNKSLTADNFRRFTFDVVPGWIEAVSQDLGPDVTPELGKEQSPLSIQYPLTTCLPDPPAEGLVGVIVNADGSLMQTPELLDSTNYPVLDDYALEQAAQQSFEPHTSSEPRAHWLPVKVIYDEANCTS